MKDLNREKIWDPVTRLWHWVLVLSVGIGWIFGQFMSFDTIGWHFYFGYLTLALIAFRCLWGFVGPCPIRFSTLVSSLRNMPAYLQTVASRQPGGSRGHNPLGSFSVLAMLLAITAQGMTGLFIESDDFFESAPLTEYISDKTIDQLTWWHHLNAKLVLILITLHILAILFYLLWKKENLIKPMLNGWKWVKPIDSD